MLVEQLRLQLGNVGSSVIPTILLALLLVWVLSNDANALAMRAWCVRHHRAEALLRVARRAGCWPPRSAPSGRAACCGARW